MFDENSPSEKKRDESKYSEGKSQEQSTFKLEPKVTISENTSEIFSVRFSPDGKFIAAGCGDGAIRVFNAFTGALAYNLLGGSNVALPTTSIRFRPTSEENKTKNVLIAANAAGSVQHWHMTSGKCLHSLFEDDKNQVYALDYDKEGTRFFTGGKDKTVRVYDEATKTLITAMRGGAGYSAKVTPGHSNRIFSVKVHPNDDNMVLTGGWDNTVQIWDVRSGYAVDSIYGPHICGDSLDVFQDVVITGSWRPEHQLEIFDLRSKEKTCDVPWHVLPGQSPCMLYAAQLSKEGLGRFIAAGGSGANEAKVFDRLTNNAIVGTVTGMHRGVFAVDFSPDSEKLAIAGGDASIRILDLVPR